ncbi:MAG: diacylglycerol kinase family protein [Thermoanaerobaculia bacterium]
MHFLFLLNPRSGRNRNLEGLERSVRTALERGSDADLETCPPLDELDRRIAHADRAGVDVVVAIGGDGTVNEIGRRLIGSRMALGVIPTGSGNGFARHLGIPLDPAAALLALARGRVESIDTAAANGRPFLMIAGVGFDALVAHRFAARGSRGLQTYLREGLTSYFTYRPEEYRITIDGRTRVEEAFVVAIANSSQYGNQARIAPLASLQDGLLDIALVRHIPLLSMPSFLWDLFNGSLRPSAHLELLHGKEIVVERAAEGAAHLDGEAVSLPARVTFSLRPGSLRAVVPASTDRI